jgi:hypothetical protein
VERRGPLVPTERERRKTAVPLSRRQPGEEETTAAREGARAGGERAVPVAAEVAASPAGAEAEAEATAA